MKIFILAEFKIQELEKDKKESVGDQLTEDLIDALKATHTCVIDDENFAIRKFEEESNLHYLYEMDLVRRLVP